MKLFSTLAILCISLVACGGGNETPITATQATQPAVEQPTTTGNNMPAGFQLFGDHGGVQIDENFINFTLSAKGTVALTPSFNYAALGAVAAVTITGDTPILCIRPLQSYVTVVSVSKNGNQFTYSMRGEAVLANTGTEQMEWFVFDKAKGISSTSGLQVFTATGQLAFSSSEDPMRIADVSSLPAGRISENPWGVSLAAGKYAVCMAQGRVETIAATPQEMYVMRDGVMVNAVGADSNAVWAETISPLVNSSPITAGGQVMLVNVAGL